MKYLLHNVNHCNMQVNLFAPGTHIKHGLHRGGPVHALNLKAGQAFDLLQHFSSIAIAKAHIKASKDALRLLKPGFLREVIIDDYGREFYDVNAYLTNPPPPPVVKKPVVVQVEVPTREQVIAAHYTPDVADYIVAEQQHLADLAAQGYTEDEIKRIVREEEGIDVPDQDQDKDMMDPEHDEEPKAEEKPQSPIVPDYTPVSDQVLAEEVQKHEEQARGDDTLPAIKVTEELAAQERALADNKPPEGE